jgi:leader peptidase (prepilin peptidase)/N-methyltransferase
MLTLIRWELLLVLGYVAAVGDLRERSIPNKLLLFMLGLWALTVLPQLLMDTEGALSYLLGAALGLAAGGGLFLLVYVISRKGLGGGDVKFIAVVGLYLGFDGVFSVMLVGALLSGLFALVMLALKRLGRKDAIPFAPFLYIGILLTIFLQ